MALHEGGCLCGELRFRITEEPLDSGYCHCRMCQLNSGAPVVAWVTVPAASFSWSAGEAKTYVSSAEGRRQFCADCGSWILFFSTGNPESIALNTASFDRPEAFPPRHHIFTASRIPWFDTTDSLPRYPEWAPPA